MSQQNNRSQLTLNKIREKKNRSRELYRKGNAKSRVEIASDKVKEEDRR